MRRLQKMYKKITYKRNILKTSLRCLVFTGLLYITHSYIFFFFKVRTSSLLLTSGNDTPQQNQNRRVSMFSINSIQEDMENQEELLRRLRAEEEEAEARREKEKLDRIARRNQLLAQKRHQIRRELERERKNQVSQQTVQQEETGIYNKKDINTRMDNCEFYYFVLFFLCIQKTCKPGRDE